MKNPKFKIVAMVILAAVVVGSVVYYSFYKAEDSTPPSITFENPLYQGFLSKDLCRLPGYEYTAADVAAYAARPYEDKDLNTLVDGVHLYHSSKELTVGNLVDKLIVPKADNEVIVAYYDYSKKDKTDFYIFPEGIAQTEYTLGKDSKIPANNGFVVMSCLETKVKDVILEENPGTALSDDVEKVDNEWILLSGVKDEDLAETLEEYEPIIKYLWVQKEAGFDFEPVKPEALDTYKYGDYYMFWIKTRDAKAGDEDKTDANGRTKDSDDDDNACEAEEYLDCTKSGDAWTAAKTYLEREESYTDVQIRTGVAKGTNQCEVTYKYNGNRQGTSILTYEQDSDDCSWSVKGIRGGDENADGTCTEEEIAAKIAALDDAVLDALGTLESDLDEYSEELQSIMDRMQEIRDELETHGVDMSEDGFTMDEKPLNETGLASLPEATRELINEFEELIRELRSEGEGVGTILEAIRKFENPLIGLVAELYFCEDDFTADNIREIGEILEDSATNEKAVLRFFLIDFIALSGQTITNEELNAAIDTLLAQARSGGGTNGAGETCTSAAEIECTVTNGPAWTSVKAYLNMNSSYANIRITEGSDAGTNQCEITYKYKDTSGVDQEGSSVFTYAQNDASCTWTVTGMAAVATVGGGGVNTIQIEPTYTINFGNRNNFGINPTRK